MKGKKHFQAELFSMVNIEGLIPKSHFLRRLDAILDLTFVHELTKNLYCENNGRPSIDPEVFFRMCLVGYLYGIASDRQLCEELRYNLAYRWFCRYSLADEIPDHLSMTRIRDRLGEEIFEEIFNQVLELCRKKKLLKDGGEILFDSSHIPANAALNSLVPKNATPEEIKNRGNVIRGKSFRNDSHVSCTDPDATLSGKTGVPKGLYYKVHSAVDAKSRVILDPHVTTGAVADGKMLFDRIEYLESKRDYEVTGVTADRAYGYGENLERLEEKGIESNIGTFHKDAAGNVKNLKYDQKKDRLQCPVGRWLYRTASAGDRGVIRYGFKDRPCTNCKMRVIRRSQGEPLPGSGKISGKSQCSDSSVHDWDRAEPQKARGERARVFTRPDPVDSCRSESPKNRSRRLRKLKKSRAGQFCAKYRPYSTRPRVSG